MPPSRWSATVYLVAHAIHKTMDAQLWKSMRESGFRTFFVGLFSLLIAFVIYSSFSAPSASSATSQQLSKLAYGTLLITAASMVAMFYGAHVLFRSEQLRTLGGSGLVSMITGAFSDRKLWRIMIGSSMIYGVFFAFLSQILVYRPDLSLVQEGVSVPSVVMTPCCSAPGYVPMLTAYLSDHFLILIIPVNVILAVVVSVMVGFNVALSVYAYRLKRTMQAKTSIISGIGAASGLFMGCPTCAGSLISAVLGIGIAGAGTTSASVLAPFQTVFIAAGIPALAIAPFLVARSIRSIFSCSMNRA